MTKVCVAWLHPGEVNAAFTSSLAGMIAWDFLREVEQGLPRQIAAVRDYHAGVNIAGPRNGVVREFLSRPDWGDWLLSIDSDMRWEPNAIEMLLESADRETAPIVGGLCFGATDNKVWPTLYELLEDDGGPYFGRMTDFPLDSLIQVSGTGGAFLMVHRSVFEAVEAKGFSKGYPWYQETELPNGPVSEDLTFCLRAGISGFPVHVDTRVRIGHVKPTLLSARKWFEQQGMLASPVPSETAKPAPATDTVPEDHSGRLAVVIPTRSRPAQVRSLLDAIHLTATTGPLVVLAVDSDDPELAEYKLIVEQRGDTLLVIVDDLPSGHVKAINVGAAQAVHDQCFAVAKLDDDHMPLTHGWDAAYLSALQELGTGVVYANDLLQGERLPTAVALTTDIVRELGYMGPPQLKHLFVDNFWLDLGTAAGCIRYLSDVVIEHRHALAGKAPMDAGYERVNAPSSYANDGATYNDYVATELTGAVAKVKALREHI